MNKTTHAEHSAPVITIDGPSGSGKGTVSLRVAKDLKWHTLDSGAIYRAIAWAILHYKIDWNDARALGRLLKHIQLVIENPHYEANARVFCDGHDITLSIREEEIGILASKVSVIPLVREAVLQYQRDFRRPPGLIADGRDMGTVVFPDAPLKFYFDANPEERAHRRFEQLQLRGINVSLRDIQEDLLERDRRDSARSVSPTKPAADAIVIDTTDKSIDAVYDVVMQHIKQHGLL